MRGYSKNARPENLDDYHYDLIASDVLALADSFNIDKFHLVGHDVTAPACPGTLRLRTPSSPLPA